MKLSQKAPRSPAERLRRYEAGLRRRRGSSRRAHIKIDDAKIEALVKRGYLMPNERDNVRAIQQAVSVFIWDSLAQERVAQTQKRVRYER